MLRIDSPGGSATASDAIWRELMIARNERADRPIVASMSDLAASGGYYIAMPAQAIVAQPSTLTGSIGIFGGKFVTGGVYEKLGANIESVSIGRHAEMNSPARPYNADETKKVAGAAAGVLRPVRREGRRVAPQHAREDRSARAGPGLDRPAGEGQRPRRRARRPRPARSPIAKERAKIAADSDVELVPYPPRKSFYELLSEELSGGGEQAAMSAWVSANLSSAELEALRALRGPLAMFRRGEAARADAVYVLTLRLQTAGLQDSGASPRSSASPAVLQPCSSNRSRAAPPRG